MEINKKHIKVYPPVEEEKIIFDSRNYGSKSEQANNYSAKIAESVMSSGKRINKQGTDIGNIAGFRGAYSYNNMSQQAVEAEGRLEKGKKVVFYDTETLGTPNHMKGEKGMNAFHLTEFGFIETEFDGQKFIKRGAGDAVVFRPNNHFNEEINNLLDDLMSGRKIGLTSDEQRTIADLVLYSDETAFVQRKIGGINVMTLQRQARDAQPNAGSIIQNRKTIERARRGLKNLNTLGTGEREAISFMSTIFGKDDILLAGQNVYNFDQHVVQQYLKSTGQTGANLTASQQRQVKKLAKVFQPGNQFDPLHYARALETSNFTSYGKNFNLQRWHKERSGRLVKKATDHFSIDDVDKTIDFANHVVSQKEYKKKAILARRMKKERGGFKIGENIISVAGSGNNQLGGVFTLGQDNGLTPAFSGLNMSPVFNNTEYKLAEYLDGVEIDGAKKWGVRLENISDRGYLPNEQPLQHVLLYNSQEELSEGMNQLFSPLPKNPKEKDLIVNRHKGQRANRRWNKLFSEDTSGGHSLAKRMYQALDIQREGEKLGWDRLKINERIAQEVEYAGGSFIRDFESLRPRLEAEEKVLRGFVNDLDEATLTPLGKNKAMSLFKRELDSQVGINIGKIETVNPVIPLEDARGVVRNINVSQTDAIRGALHGYMKGGIAGKPNTRQQRNNFKKLISELKAIDPKLAKKYDTPDMMNQVLELTNRDSLDTILQEIANDLYESKEAYTKMGLNQIQGEVVQSVLPDRLARMEKMPTNVLQGIKQKAVSQASVFEKRFRAEGDLMSFGLNGNVARGNLSRQEEILIRMMKDSGITFDARDKGKAMGTNIRADRMINPAQDYVNIANAYRKNGFNVQIREGGKYGGFTMIMSDAERSAALLNGTMEELSKNNHVAMIHLPTLNNDGTLSYGGTPKVNRVTSKVVGGQRQFQTALHDVHDTIERSAYHIKDQLKKTEVLGLDNGMLTIENMISGRIRQTINNISSNSSRTSQSATGELLRTTRSKRADWTRGGLYDASAHAEEWYESFFNQSTDARKKAYKLKSPSQIKDQTMESSSSFFDAMPINARRRFLREAPQYLKETHGLDVSYGSVSDRQAVKGLVNMRSVQDLSVGGVFNQLSRENMNKVTNYIALDEDTVRSGLNGKFNDEQINRMIKSGVVSKQEKKVIADEIGYLNINASRMNVKKLHERIEGKNLLEKYKTMFDKGEISKAEYNKLIRFINNKEAYNTYDGAVILSEAIRDALSVERESKKRFQLARGERMSSDLVEKIQREFDKIGETFDPNQAYDFMEMGLDIDFTGLESRGGRITVGEVVKEGIQGGESIHPSPGTFIKKIEEKKKVKSWNPVTGDLETIEKTGLKDASKIVTDQGDRSTVTFAPQRIIDDITGEKGILGIFEDYSHKKGQEGTLIAGQIKLAEEKIQELYTVGKMKKGETVESGLAYIKSLLVDGVGMPSSEIAIEDGQLVLGNLNKWDTTKSGFSLGKFSKEFGEKFDSKYGTNVFSGDTLFTRIGIGVHNVTEFEHAIGYQSKTRQGLVKVGYKEVDMVKRKAEKIGIKKSQVASFMDDHIAMYGMSDPYIKELTGEILSRDSSRKYLEPSAGDVVIRTSGHGFEDAGRVIDGRYEINADHLLDLPNYNSRDTLFTVGDYNKTVMDWGQAQIGEDGRVVSQVTNKKTALFELPESPHAKFSRKYAEFYDFGGMRESAGLDVPMFSELEKNQMKIYREQQYFKALHNDVDLTPDQQLEKITQSRDKIEKYLTERDDLLVNFRSSSRDGSIAKSLTSAKFDMAGQFRIQGVNPVTNYTKGTDGVFHQTGKYKEGRVYVSEKRLLGMIEGREQQVAETLGLDLTSKTFTVQDLQKEILGIAKDQDSDVGLYGLMERQPIISQGTVQSLRIQVDEAIDPTEGFSARITAGTAARLKADNDGDVGYITMTHYGVEDAKQRKAIVDELGLIQRLEEKEGLIEGAKIAEDLHTSTAFDMSLKQASVAEDASINQAMWKIIKQRNSIGDEATSAEARLGKELIGSIDNIRQKIFTVQDLTYNIIKEQGLESMVGSGEIVRRKDALEEFGRTLSQEFISSKKLDKESIINQILEKNTGVGYESAESMAVKTLQERFLVINEMKEAVLTGTNESAARFKELNESIQLFDTSDEARVRAMNEGLDEIQRLNKYTAASGGLRNMSLQDNLSQGLTTGQSGALWDADNRYLLPTPSISKALENMDQGSEVYSRASESVERAKQAITQSFISNEGSSQTFTDAIINSPSRVDVDTSISRGLTRAEQTGNVLGSVMKGMEIDPSSVKRNLGSVGKWGAAVFGGIWATSRLTGQTPTPEGMKENQEMIVPSSVMQAPTARIEQQGERINLSISASSIEDASPNDISNIVREELSMMTQMNMNMNMNVSDNLTNIDNQWMQEKVNNAINFGVSF